MPKHRFFLVDLRLNGWFILANVFRRGCFAVVDIYFRRDFSTIVDKSLFRGCSTVVDIYISSSWLLYRGWYIYLRFLLCAHKPQLINDFSAWALNKSKNTIKIWFWFDFPTIKFQQCWFSNNQKSHNLILVLFCRRIFPFDFVKGFFRLIS